MVGRKILALLMCVVVALIAASPLARSEPETVHEIIKDENGPPSTCAETWEVTPLNDWTWHGHIVNYGLRWLIIDVIDIETGDILIDREMYRFALYPEGWVDTMKVNMVAGHTYSITATPNGPLGSSCTVEDVLEGAPVATFTMSVDGATVFVDASASYDPDGTIVSYEWYWGDGSVGTGETATHTYVLPLGGAGETASSLALGIEYPHPIVGHCYDIEGNVLIGCEVIVTDVTLGASGVAVWDGDYYSYDIANLPGEWAIGDEILVEATMGLLSGFASGIASDGFYDIIDVTLEWNPQPGPVEVPITLTVTDDDGLTDTMTQTVIIEVPEDPPVPPVAAFTASVDGLTVFVDASASYDPDGTIVSYDWDWGDGTVGTGETATHTYVAPETVTTASLSTLSLLRSPNLITGGTIDFPHIIFGWTTDVNGLPLPYCTVSVTNVRNGWVKVTESDADGFYGVELPEMGEYYWLVGDEILVEAVKGDLFGSAVDYATASMYDIINVTLEWNPQPGPVEVPITLTVTDDDGLTDTMTQTVIIEVPPPPPAPPVAAFTVSVDELTVSVDASASYDPDGAIVSYDWDWGDGTTGTGVTATHTYVEPEGGSVPFDVTITLTVTDDDGLESTKSRVVDLLNPPLFSEFFADLDDWTVFDTGGLVDLDSSGDAIDPPSLRMHKQQVEGETRAYREFSAQGGIFHIEARMKVATMCWADEGWAYFSVGAASLASVTFCFKQGYLQWYEQDTQSFHSVMAFSIDTPYLIGFNIDVQAGTYDIYVDHVLKWSNAELRLGPGVPLDQVTFQAGWLDLCYGTNLWADDVELTTA